MIMHCLDDTVFEGPKLSVQLWALDQSQKYFIDLHSVHLQALQYPEESLK